MGLLQDLASLALASAVRSSAGIARLPDSLPRRVEEQLSHPSGELIGLLAAASERAWHGLEFVLSADALWTLYGPLAPAAPDLEMMVRALRRIREAFPRELIPEELRQRCVAELQAARTARLLTREILNPSELSEEVGVLLNCDSYVLTAQETAYVARLAASLRGAGMAALAELMLLNAPHSPLVVRIAAGILLNEFARRPGLIGEIEAMGQEGALELLEDVLTHYGPRAEEWLQELVLSLPPGAIPEAFPVSEDVSYGVQREAEEPQPPTRVWKGRSAPGAPPPPPAAAPLTPMPVAASAPQLTGMPADRMTAAEESGSRGDGAATKKDLRRRASMRWFRRMNPQRMYPLTVALAMGRIKEVKVKGVQQAVSAELLVVSASNPYITIRPILPGVLVYPPEQTVDVTNDLVTVRFQVLPQMLGPVPDARIEFYWRQRLLTSIELPMKVSKQTMAIVVSFAGLLWPFVGSAMKSVGVQDEPKDVVRRYLFEFMRWPYAIEAGLAVLSLLAVGFWWWNRPRESSEETDVLSVKPMPFAELLAEGRRCLLLEHWDEARSYYEDAVNTAPDNAEARSGLCQAQARRFISMETG